MAGWMFLSILGWKFFSTSPIPKHVISDNPHPRSPFIMFIHVNELLLLMYISDYGGGSGGFGGFGGQGMNQDQGFNMGIYAKTVGSGTCVLTFTV